AATYRVFALAKPEFVYALRIRYTLSRPANDKATFRLFWMDRRRLPRQPSSCTQTHEWLPLPPEKTIHVWVNDTIDRFGIRLGPECGAWDIREVILYQPPVRAGPEAFQLSRAGPYNSGMDIDTTLQVLARDPHAPFDVAEVALALARDEYPDLDVEAYLSEL